MNTSSYIILTFISIQFQEILLYLNIHYTISSSFSKIDAELIDLPDSIYLADILILNGHPSHVAANQGRQENFDALIEFIHDAKTIGGN